MILCLLDMNNLYGCSQLFKLPEKNFVLIDDTEKSTIDWRKADPNDRQRYIFEVDLIYPSKTPLITQITIENTNNPG